MDRKAFLKRVRQAAVSGRAYRVPPEDLPADVGYVGAGQDLCGALADEVKAVGGLPQVLHSAEEVGHGLDRLLDECNARSALCWRHPLLERLGVAELLDNKRIKRDDYDSLVKLPFDQQRERILAADVGISSVDHAVAETGSLVVCSQPGQERVISLVPPVHIAIVVESQIVPDLFDIFARLQEAGLDNLPSNLAFISGPSKTGDIELQLTTGVHGPGQLHVLIIRGS